MIIESTRQLILKSIFIKIIIGILIILIFIFYFKVFSTKGAYFYGIFLKKEVFSSGTQYTGNSKKGSIQIIVKGQIKNQSSVDVIYRLPNNVNYYYTVNFDDVTGPYIGIQNIKDKDGKIAFSGGNYSRDIHYLTSKDGQTIFDTQVIVNGESPYNSDYIIYPDNEVSLSNVVSFATSENDLIRGQYEYLVPAIFILVFTLIDIKFPLFFFYIRNFLVVKDPEPSELYTTIQRAGWLIGPAIAFILMIAAIF